MDERRSRLLDLLSLLQARRDWPGAELAERLAVPGRTIRRDVGRLRALGHPVESMTGPAATGTRFTARRPPAKDAAAYVEQSIAGAGRRYEARVTVHASADEVAVRLPYAAGALEPIDAHHCEYRTSGDVIEWLAIRIAMLGVDVDVHEPPELIAELDALARRLGRAAATSRRSSTRPSDSSSRRADTSIVAVATALVSRASRGTRASRRARRSSDTIGR